MCLSAKPIVDGLELELEGAARVVRLNVKDDVGRDLFVRHRLGLVPAFLVFDGEGREVWRQQGGYPDVKAVRAAVARSGSG